MRLPLFTVYDSKAEAYLRPFMAQSNATALRSFGDAVSEDTSPMALHPEDYTLFVCGVFDELTGKVEGQVPMSLANGLDVRRIVDSSGQLRMVGT